MNARIWRICLLWVVPVTVLLLMLPAVGCSVSKARSAVETQLRINQQVSEWHVLIDSVIRQLAAEEVTEEQAGAILEEHINAVEGNVRLLQLWQDMRNKIDEGQPLMAVLIDASAIVGELSQRYQLALEQLEADLADKEDGADATLLVIGAVLTAVTGLPVAGVFSSFTSKRARAAGVAEGRAVGIEDGAFYGAAKVASAFAAGKKVNPAILNPLKDDKAPETLRVKGELATDDVVARAVRAYKDSEAPPVKPR